MCIPYRPTLRSSVSNFPQLWHVPADLPAAPFSQDFTRVITCCVTPPYPAFFQMNSSMFPLSSEMRTEAMACAESRTGARFNEPPNHWREATPGLPSRCRRKQKRKVGDEPTQSNISDTPDLGILGQTHSSSTKNLRCTVCWFNTHTPPKHQQEAKRLQRVLGPCFACYAAR